MNLTNKDIQLMIELFSKYPYDNKKDCLLGIIDDLKDTEDQKFIVRLEHFILTKADEEDLIDIYKSMLGYEDTPTEVLTKVSIDLFD